MSRTAPIKSWTLLSMLTTGAVCAMSGCGATRPEDAATSVAAPAEKKEPMVAFFTAPKQSGAALWAANCNRCHNAVPSTAFRSDEWDLVLHHMRMRANLTGQETRAIADFLKAGS